jgi:hypothetical protein
MSVAIELFEVVAAFEFHELHLAVSDGRSIERFREAWIVDKAELSVIQPDRPGGDCRLQDIACHWDSSTCRHVKSIQTQEPRSKGCPFRGRRLQAFVHQPQFFVASNILDNQPRGLVSPQNADDVESTVSQRV